MYTYVHMCVCIVEHGTKSHAVWCVPQFSVWCVCQSVHCWFTEPMGVAAMGLFGVTMTTALGCLSPSTVTS